MLILHLQKLYDQGRWIKANTNYDTTLDLLLFFYFLHSLIYISSWIPELVINTLLFSLMKISTQFVGRG